MKRIFSKEIKIGFAVLVALVILFFGINYLKGINLFKADNYYYVSYTNVAGLTQSSPVTVNGYKVGVVREINYEYDNPGHVLVELSLDKKLRIPQGTEAVIVPDLMGTPKVELRMSNSTNYHVIGDKLAGVLSESLMDKVATEVMPTVMTVATDVDSLVRAVTTIAASPALLSAVDRLDAVMANLEASTVKLNAAMASVPAIAGNANSVMADAKVIAANLNEVSKTLSALSAQLKNVPLDSTMNNIHAITKNLTQATEMLNSTNSSLGLLLNDPSLYNNLNSSSAHLDSILIDVKKQPKRYIPPIKIF